MNNIDRILENVQKEVELYGRSGYDNIFIDNYQFSIPADQYEIPSQAAEDEGLNDVAWFFTCARKNMVVPHPAPDRSFWLKFFGNDALPYGPSWNIKKLVETIKNEEKQRQKQKLEKHRSNNNNNINIWYLEEMNPWKNPLEKLIKRKERKRKRRKRKIKK